MAKPKKEKVEAEQSKSVTLTSKLMIEFEKMYATGKQKCSDASMEVGRIMNRFQEQGGNNKAFKLAVWTKQQEEAKAQDFVRSYIMYCHELGVFKQLDLLDEVPKFKVVNTTASRPAPSAPSIPQEATAH